MRKDQLDVLELDGPIILRTLDECDGWNDGCDVMEDREMPRPNLELLPPQPSQKKREMKKEVPAMRLRC